MKSEIRRTEEGNKPKVTVTMNNDSNQQGHSIFAPSQIEAVILCPGRIKMCKGLKGTSSKYAAEGTFAHSLAASFLELAYRTVDIDQDPSPLFQNLSKKDYLKEAYLGFLGETKHVDGHDIIIPEEMLFAVEFYVRHCLNLRRTAIVTFLSSNEISCIERIEDKVTLNLLRVAEMYETVDKETLEALRVPEIYGTVDYAISSFGDSSQKDTLFIRDFKYGKGIAVSPEWNAQLICYALGCIERNEFESYAHYEKINIGIVQPRVTKTPLIWETTPEKLYEWCKTTLIPTIKKAQDKNASCIPGEIQCRWCLAKGICKALHTKLSSTITDDFTSYDTISTDQAKDIIKNKKLIIDFITAVEDNIRGRLLDGEELKGLQLKQGRQQKSWRYDRGETFALLDDIFSSIKDTDDRNNYIFDYKLVSPAKALKNIEKLYENIEYDEQYNRLMQSVDINHNKASIITE